MALIRSRGKCIILQRKILIFRNHSDLKARTLGNNIRENIYVRDK